MQAQCIKHSSHHQTPSTPSPETLVRQVRPPRRYNLRDICVYTAYLIIHANCFSSSTCVTLKDRCYRCGVESNETSDGAPERQLLGGIDAGGEGHMWLSCLVLRERVFSLFFSLSLSARDPGIPFFPSTSSFFVLLAVYHCLLLVPHSSWFFRAAEDNGINAAFAALTRDGVATSQTLLCQHFSGILDDQPSSPQHTLWA